MNKLMLLSCASAVALAFTGCHSLEADKWTLAARQNILENTFKPQVRIVENKLVEGEAHFTKTWWFVTVAAPAERAVEMYSSGTLPVLGLPREVCEAALYDACQKANADLLIAPRYTITEDSSFLNFNRDLKVTVKGIPAVIDGASEIKYTDEQIYNLELYKTMSKGGATFSLGMPKM